MQSMQYVGCDNGKSRQEQTSEISAGSRIKMRVRIMFSGANCACTRPQKIKRDYLANLAHKRSLHNTKNIVPAGHQLTRLGSFGIISPFLPSQTFFSRENTKLVFHRNWWLLIRQRMKQSNTLTRQSQDWIVTWQLWPMKSVNTPLSAPLTSLVYD